MEDVIVLVVLFFIFLDDFFEIWCFGEVKWELGVDDWVWGIEIILIKGFLMCFNENILFDGVFLDYGLDIGCLWKVWEFLEKELEFVLFL